MSVIWASSGGAPAAAPIPSIALLRKKMVTHPLIPNIWVAAAPSSAPPVISARGAMASDNIPMGAANSSSAPKDTAPKIPTSAASIFEPRPARSARYRPTRIALAPPAIRMKALPASAIGSRRHARANAAASSQVPVCSSIIIVEAVLQ